MTARAPLVLSLYLNWSGVGYVLFEKPLTPYDWGLKAGRGTNRHHVVLRTVEKLLVLYRPTVVILEDWTDRETPRCKRIEATYEAILTLCERMAVPVECVPIRIVRRAFAKYDATTKEEIAQVIAARIPALSFHVPPKRKIWKPEPPRQALFDAAALALTFFQRPIS